MDREFIKERIAATKALIVAYEDALTALSEANGVQTYSLDTGQSTQSVTRANIPNLNRMLDSLYNRLATLEAQLYGTSLTARPAW